MLTGKSIPPVTSAFNGMSLSWVDMKMDYLEDQFLIFHKKTQSERADLMGKVSILIKDLKTLKSSKKYDASQVSRLSTHIARLNTYLTIQQKKPGRL